MSLNDTVQTKPVWHVLGPGAIGSLFACHLNQAQFPVRILTRTPSEDARLIGLEEKGHIQTCAFTVDKSAHPIQRLLVTVKAHQTEAALQSLAHRIGPQTLIVLLQNGMGTWDITQRLFPSSPCVIGTTTEGAHRDQHHHVIHAGRGETWLGSLNPSSHIAESLVQQWREVTLNIGYSPNIHTKLWQKLAINCAINPLTVVYDCPNGQLLASPNARNTMQAICKEVEQVMQEVALIPQQPGDLFTLACRIAQATGNNLSSMLQDYRRGLPTEIEFITGYLLQQAKQAGLDLPHNQNIYDSIVALAPNT